MNWPSSPFPVGYRIDDDRYFFDREDELRSIGRGLFAQGGSIWQIFGPRRIGKTSLLRKCARVFSQWARVALLDFQNVRFHQDDGDKVVKRNRREIVDEVLRNIGQQWASEMDMVFDPSNAVIDVDRFVMLVKRLRGSASERPFVVLVDECEHARTSNPWVLDDLLEAVLACGSLHVRAVLSEGRQLGQKPSRYLAARLGGKLKDAPRTEIGHFHPELISSLLTRCVSQYRYAPDAVEAVADLTNGHPLFFCALNDYLYNSRKERLDDSDMHSSEVYDAAPKLVDVIESQFEWLWHDISPLHSYLARAIADLTWDAAGSRFNGTVALDRIVAELSARSTVYSRDQIVQAAESFRSNNVLYRDPEDDSWRLFAPLFGYWIRKLSVPEMIAISNPEIGRLMEEARSFCAEHNWEAAHESARLALDLDSRNVEVLQLAGEINERLGLYDDALRHLRSAGRDRDTGPLTEFLIRRLLQSSSNDPVEIWYSELLSVSAEAAYSASIQFARLAYHENRWKEAFYAREDASALSSFSTLLDSIESSTDFGRTSVDRIGNGLEQLCMECLISDEKLRRGLWLLENCVVPFTRLLPRQDLSALENEIRAGLQNRDESDREAILADVLSVLNRQSSPLWSRSIDLLEEVIRRRIKSAEGAPISLDTVRHFLTFSPPSVLAKVQKMCSEYLLNRLSALLRRDFVDAAETLSVLCSLPRPPHDGIWVVLDDRVNELATLGDNEFLDFFKGAPEVYSFWLDCAPETLASDIATQFDSIATRLRKPDAAPQDDDLKQDEIIIRGGRAYKEWMRLLDHRIFRSVGRAVEIRRRFKPAEEIEQVILLRGTESEPPWETEIRDLLGDAYLGVRLLPIKLHGIRPDLARIYEAFWDGKPVHLKVFRIDKLQDQPRLERLLTYLWHNENRALQTLASHSSSRSLVQFRFVDGRPQLQSRGIRVVVTEAAGNLPLRRALESRVSLFSDQESVWREVSLLIDAVAYIHRLNYLHRAIRPENIFVQISESKHTFSLKLSNFEWSVYLHALASHHEAKQELDYYSAPEFLRLETEDKSHLQAGESFGTDIYALGLTLFELTVRRFKAVELCPFVDRSQYVPENHRRWILGLLREIDRTFARPEEEDKRFLLRCLIQPEPQLRCRDLTPLIPLVQKLAIRSSHIHELLHDKTHRPILATTLYREADEDKRSGSSKSIERFIREADPRANLGIGQEGLASYLEEQLADARIYRNKGPAPLFVEGKRLKFVIQPFQDRELAMLTSDGSAYFDLPFVMVAKPGDQREGPQLADLGSVHFINFVDAKKMIKDQAPALLRQATAWRSLFQAASPTGDGHDRVQRDFYSLLEMTLTAETHLWHRQVFGYEQVGTLEEDKSRIKITIRHAESERDKKYKLDRLDKFVIREAGREDFYYELRSSSDPLLPSEVGSAPWRYEGPGNSEGTIVLSRSVGAGSTPPKERGFIRPVSLAGNRAVYNRRIDLLRILKDDRYLLTALTELDRVRRREPSYEFSADPSLALDEDKKRIIRRVLDEPPFFAVQGPPGTGKTTMAAEVVRETLRRNPSSRILVVSQAHDPLDNLLLKVDESYKKQRSELPTIIRLLTVPREDSSHVQGFLPSEATRRLLENVRWSPPEGSRFTRDDIEDWRAFCIDQAKSVTRSLETRIANSANLVFVTANDRSLADLPEDRTFDLLIFEEAARAYPLEIIGAMRSARRWLLIGDQQQLSPFAIDDFKTQLDRIVKEGPDIDRSRWTSDIANYFDFLYRGGCFGASPMAVSLPDADRSSYRVPSDGLMIQWRMHPDIGDLMRRVYYPQLKNGDEVRMRTRLRHGLERPAFLKNRAVLWIDVPLANKSRVASEAPAAGGGFYNRYEIAVLRNLIRQIQGPIHTGHRIAFLSPYRAQVNLINRTFKNWANPQALKEHEYEFRNRAFTIDSFQGRQVDIAIVSLVRNNTETTDRSRALGFLDQDEGRARTGVMCSRGQCLLVIVGCSAHFDRFGDDFHLKQVADCIDTHIPARDLLNPADDDYLRRGAEDTPDDDPEPETYVF